ncbi:hypothetical protein D3C81_2126120 [compost metagenome]
MGYKSYREMSMDLMFGSFKVEKALVNYEFRTKKGVTLTIEDVKNARRKAIKNGFSKTEYELRMMELYIKDVFKKRRKKIEKQV